MTDFQNAFKHIDRFITKWKDESGIPGMAVGITNREKTLRISTHGYADIANKVPVTPETLFEIGSLGKPFTSIAILQLCDEGKLDLHKPVQEYLPWFEVQSEYPPITLHHLLNHTSGIVRGTDLAPHGLYESWNLRNTVTAAPPGEYFSYSNLGYKTLGFVLERITGQPLGDIIQSRILYPLEMTASYPATTLETREKEATGYCGIYDDRPEHISHTLVPALWSEYGTGDGCEISTASDMVKYLRMLLNGGYGPVKRLISEENFKLMTLHGIWTGGDYYGYGLATYPDEGRTYIGHGGGNAGYRSAIVVDMEAGLGVVFLLNRMGETDPVVAAAQYVLTVMRAESRNEEIPPLPPPDFSTVVKNAEEYAGTYRSGDDEFDLFAKVDNLIMKHKDENILLE
ncbi:MAG: beta-lactamase family protein, partial [Dehalococcoidales bacterium]